MPAMTRFPPEAWARECDRYQAISEARRAQDRTRHVGAAALWLLIVALGVFDVLIVTGTLR